MKRICLWRHGSDHDENICYLDDELAKHQLDSLRDHWRSYLAKPDRAGMLHELICGDGATTLTIRLDTIEMLGLNAGDLEFAIRTRVQERKREQHIERMVSDEVGNELGFK